MFVLVGTWVFEALCLFVHPCSCSSCAAFMDVLHKWWNIEVENLLEQLPGWAGVGLLGKPCYPWGVPRGGDISGGIRNCVPWGGTSWSSWQSFLEHLENLAVQVGTWDWREHRACEIPESLLRHADASWKCSLRCLCLLCLPSPAYPNKARKCWRHRARSWME